MNLTTDEATKVIEALERASAMIGCPPGDNAKADVYRECLSALAILQAAKDRPQPEPVAWMRPNDRALVKDWIKNDGEKTFQDFTIPLYTHPPQPAVDKLIEAGDAMHDHIGRLLDLRLVGDLRTECYVVRNRYIAAKSAAPVDAPKVLTDDEVVRLAEQASQDIGTQAAIVGVLKYARDNGYLAPAKVDVDAVYELVENWLLTWVEKTDPEASDYSDLRARLTKLFEDPTTKLAKTIPMKTLRKALAYAILALAGLIVFAGFLGSAHGRYDVAIGVTVFGILMAFGLYWAVDQLQ